MSNLPDKVFPDELQRRREEIRHGLFRVNTAVLLIVTVVIGLAIGGILAAYHASEQADQARRASEQAKAELWKSYLAQATAGRLSALMGRKSSGRQAVVAAAQIRPSLELRNEAIANLALTDLSEVSSGDIVEAASTFAFDPGSNRIAVGQTNGLVRVLDGQTKAIVLSYQGRSSKIDFLTFSPDGGFLLVKEHENNFYVLDLAQGKPAFSRPVLRPFDFSADGRTFALLESPKVIRLWQAATGEERGPALQLSDAARDIALSPDGDRLLVNIGRTLQVWSLGGQLLQTLPADAGITAMAWVGRHVAIGDEDGGIRVWDLHSRRSKTWSAHKMMVDFLVFDHAENVLASSSFDGVCRLWNPRTGDLILETTRGFPLGFSRDDSRLAFSVRSSARSRWGWWQVSGSDVFRAFDVSDGASVNVYQVDFSPNSQLLAVTKNEGVTVLDVASGRILASLPMTRARSAFFLPDARSLLTCGENRLSVWPLDCKEGAVANLELGRPRHIPLPETEHVDSPCISADRTRVALPVSDTCAVLFRLEDPAHPVLFSGGDKPKTPCISPDGKWVVTGTFHGAGSTVWDASSGKKLLQLDSGNSNPVFSPDGKLLLVAGDKDYRIYESGTWKLLRRIPTGSASDLPACGAFSRDGRMLAIVKERRLVQLIEPRKWNVLAELTGPETQIINSLAFAWDGSSLAVGTANDAVHVWNLRQLDRKLSEIGLAWESPVGLKVIQAVEAGVFTPGSYRFLVIATAGVAMVVLCAWFVLRRQRQLFRAYLQADTLIEQGNRELEMAKTELMHSQKMKALGTLAAGIAHDFNNLLSVIRMSNKLIARETAAQADIAENVAEVERAVQQGKTLVRSMLGYSRQETGNGYVSLPELVEDTVGLLSRQFLSGITLDLQLDRGTPPLKCSRARLEQILLNLIVNASEAMDGAGVLRIVVRTTTAPVPCSILAPKAAAQYVELTVADSGKGIDSAIAQRIFEPFFTTKPRGEKSGTGLGLSMVHSMAEQDGLGIALESAPETGTTFRIVVPVEPKDLG